MVAPRLAIPPNGIPSLWCGGGCNYNGNIVAVLLGSGEEGGGGGRRTYSAQPDIPCIIPRKPPSILRTLSLLTMAPMAEAQVPPGLGLAPLVAGSRLALSKGGAELGSTMRSYL